MSALSSMSRARSETTAKLYNDDKYANLQNINILHTSVHRLISISLIIAIIITKHFDSVVQVYKQRTNGDNSKWRIGYMHVANDDRSRAVWWTVLYVAVQPPKPDRFY